MIIDRLLPRLANSPELTRRRFVTLSIGGAVGLALMPLATPEVRAQNAPDVPPGQKPTEQPAAFVTIAKDGTTTGLCNRMDMGQGIETALGNYVDPAMGMHLTGGSNSVKNSCQQYRELGARTKAMLIAAASQQLGVPPAQLKAAGGVVTGGGKSATYGELFEAAMKQPVPATVVLKDPKAFKLIGQPTGLKVSKAKSTGAQGYGIDIRLPGMLTAAIVRPPVFNARFASFDAADALKVKGVKAVLPVDLDRGGKGLAIVADGYWPAKMGRNALKVQWDTAGVEKTDTTALVAKYLEMAKTPGLPAPQPHFNADVSALAGAPKKISADFVFPYLNHAQMEPLAATVDLKADKLTIYAASQMPGVDAGAAAAVSGLKPEQVQIVVQMAGGGFGRRATLGAEWVREAVNVAKALAADGKAAPVKVVWSREDDMKAGYYRPLTVHHAEIGFDAAGKVLAWDHTIVS